MQYEGPFYLIDEDEYTENLDLIDITHYQPLTLESSITASAILRERNESIEESNNFSESSTESNNLPENNNYISISLSEFLKVVDAYGKIFYKCFF
jgi:hypothetical protein